MAFGMAPTINPYAGLMIIDEDMISLTRSKKTSSVTKYIGGVNWSLRVWRGKDEEGGPAGGADLELVANTWRGPQQIVVEATFVSSWSDGNQQLSCFEKVDRKLFNKHSKKNTNPQISCDHEKFGERGHKVSVYVRILQCRALGDYHFTSTLTRHNLVLNVGGTCFYVEKEHLMALSPVFTAMFNGNFAEGQQEVVKIEDVNWQTFDTFLRAIQPFSKERPNPHTVEGLAMLADRFDVSPLKEDCAQHLLICPELSLLERLTIAHRYHLDQVFEMLAKVEMLLK